MRSRSSQGGTRVLELIYIGELDFLARPYNAEKPAVPDDLAVAEALAANDRAMEEKMREKAPSVLSM